MRVITACDELAGTARKAANAEQLNFSSAQFELLIDQLDEVDEACRAIWKALMDQWRKANARAESLRKILDKGV